MSLEAEKIVLACVLREPDKRFALFSELSEEDFSTISHRKVYSAMRGLSNKNEHIDSISVSAAIGGASNEIVDDIEASTPTSSVFGHYAGIVRSASCSRILSQHLRRITSDLESNPNITDVIEELRNEVSKIAERVYKNKRKSDVFGPGEAYKIAMQTIDERVSNPGFRGLRTGFPTLDEVLLGLRQTTLVGGSTGMGKTAIALNIACNLAIRDAIPTLYINYEMDAQDILFRLCGILSGIKINDLITGNVQKENIPNLGKNVAKLRDGKLTITGHASKTLDETIDLIYRHHAQDGIKVVFIDYIGLIAPDSLARQEQSEYYTFSRYLKALTDRCEDLGIKLIVLVQLNRGTDDEMPKKSNIAGSYKLMQDADASIAIGYSYKNDQYCLAINKNRHGKYPVNIPIEFDKDTQRAWEVI